MSESVEQAALRRAASVEHDWQGRARREAAAILDETGVVFDQRVGIVSRDELVSILAIAWLQGVNLGSHETLAAAEVAFENVRAAL
jgi:hypothetical protein